MRKSTPNWLVISVAQGIALLIGARLQGSPFAGNQEDTQAVCEAWLVALMNMPIDWHEDADKWRLEAAFQKLLPKCRKWPAPAELFDYLPQRLETTAPKLSHRPDLYSSTRLSGYQSLNQIRTRLNLPERTF
jgi:hypothetical protein